MIGNLSIVLPYAPAAIGIAGAVRKKSGARINGPLRVLALLVVVAALLLFALGIVPSEATTGETVLRFARCSLLLALESFGIIFGSNCVWCSRCGCSGTEGLHAGGSRLSSWMGTVAN